MLLRSVKLPRPAGTARIDTEPGIHGKIDSALKDLRACSRRLAAVASAMTDDLRILARLYYKGKNQHRSALFWRNVAEVRKFGQRISELHLFDFVDGLRYAFYGDDVQSKSKALKGTWTQMPDSHFLLSYLQRTQAYSLLVDTARERFQGAHHAFTLLMQTGAFLQLALTLTSIVSRLDMLSVEVQAVLGALSGAIRQLSTNVMKRPKDTAPGTRLDVFYLNKPLVERAMATSILTTGTAIGTFSEEDLGTVIAATVSTSPVNITTEIDMDVSGATAECSTRMNMITTSTLGTSDQHFRSASTNETSNTPAHFNGPSQRYIRKPQVVEYVIPDDKQINTAAMLLDEKKPVKTVKKKCKNAIDDIFGGL